MAFDFIVDDTTTAKLSGLPTQQTAEHCPFMVGDLISSSGGIAWRVTQRWYSAENPATGKPATWHLFLTMHGDPLQEDPQSA